MQFGMSEEDTIVATTVRRAFGKVSPDRARGSNGASLSSIEDALVGLGLQPAQGGDDLATSIGTLRIAYLVAFEAGRAALPYPVLETLIASVLRQRSAKACDVLVIDSGCSAAVASPSPRDTLSLEAGCLQGRLALLAFPGIAAVAIAPAWDLATSRSAVVVVDPRRARAQSRPRNSVEPTYPLADVIARRLPVDDDHVIASLDDGTEAGCFLELAAAVLAAAEIAGAATAALDLTKDYLESRIQFDRPLSANQVLRHMMAANHVRVEAMVAAVRYASLALDAQAADAEIAVRAAKHYASVSGKCLAEDMLQLHGAIGFTAEYRLGRFLCRILRLAAMHGTPQREAEILLDLLAEGGPG